jgi:hypothetical protein
MYHNWYEVYVSAQQARRDLYRQAEDARRAEEARKARKKERKRARVMRSGREVSEAEGWGQTVRQNSLQTAR